LLHEYEDIKQDTVASNYASDKNSDYPYINRGNLPPHFSKEILKHNTQVAKARLDIRTLTESITATELKMNSDAKAAYRTPAYTITALSDRQQTRINDMRNEENAEDVFRYWRSHLGIAFFGSMQCVLDSLEKDIPCTLDRVQSLIASLDPETLEPIQKQKLSLHTQNLHEIVSSVRTLKDQYFPSNANISCDTAYVADKES